MDKPLEWGRSGGKIVWRYLLQTNPDVSFAVLKQIQDLIVG
jgi:hypothetical protein